MRLFLLQQSKLISLILATQLVLNFELIKNLDCSINERRFAEKPKQSRHLITINIILMQKLKILSLFITLALLGILITSCEKENLVNDSITLAEQPLLEIKHNNPNLNEISLRNFQGLDEVYVDVRGSGKLY